MLHARALILSISVMMSACIVHHHHYDEGPSMDGDVHDHEPRVEEFDGQSEPARPYQGEAHEPDPVHSTAEESMETHEQPPARSPEPSHSSAEPAESSPEPVAEPREPPRWHRPSAQDETDRASSRGATARAPAADTSSGVPGDFLPGCRSTSHPSGWILADCRDMNIILITGPAAQRGDETLAALTGDKVTRQVAGNLNAGVGVSMKHEGAVKLAGDSYPARRITAGPRDMGSAIGFFAPDRKPSTYRGSGLFTVVEADVGKVAAACHQEGNLDEDRCLNILDELLRRGLSDVAPPPDATVSVAGVPMAFQQACHYNTPTTLVCKLAGSLRWFKGSPAEARRRLQSLLSFYQDDHGIEGYHNPHDTFACTIGGRSAECHEIAVQGVLDTPNNILYAAVVDTPDGSYQFSCKVRIDDEMNEPCSLLLSGAHSGRWH